MPKSFGFTPILQQTSAKTETGRDQSNTNDGCDYDGKIIPNQRQVSKKIPAPNEDGHPGKASQYAITEKITVSHPADPCHKRSKSTDDRDEPCQGDGFSAMFGIKSLGPINVFLLDKPDLFPA